MPMLWLMSVSVRILSDNPLTWQSPRCASASTIRLLHWFTSAGAINIATATRAKDPNSGCNMRIPARNGGVHGGSNKAIKAGEDTHRCMASRFRNPVVPFASSGERDAPIAASKKGFSRACGKPLPDPAIRRVRQQSRIPVIIHKSAIHAARTSTMARDRLLSTLS